MTRKLFVLAVSSLGMAVLIMVTALFALMIGANRLSDVLKYPFCVFMSLFFWFAIASVIPTLIGLWRGK